MDIRWIYSVEWQLKEDITIWTTYHCWVCITTISPYITPHYSGAEYTPAEAPYICAGDRVMLEVDIELLMSFQEAIGERDSSIFQVQYMCIYVHMFSTLCNTLNIACRE